MGNTEATSETAGGDAQIEGKPNLELQLRRAQREAARIRAAEIKEANERENKRQQDAVEQEKKRREEYDEILTIWLQLFEAATRRWVETNNEALLAAVRKNEYTYDLAIDVAIPPETSARMIGATSSKSLEVFVNGEHERMTIAAQRIVALRVDYLRVEIIHKGTETVVRNVMQIWPQILRPRPDDTCGCVVC
ncbi:MAG: hypothetical protein KGL39_01485 [Patescibacteria group bacterium]|nr:hypothetical protein [Patescibacteria group bacterium]